MTDPASPQPPRTPAGDEAAPGASAPWRHWLGRRDQVALASAAAICLMTSAIWWGLRGGGQGRLLEIDRAAPLRIDLQVDLNEADWSELSLLPGVGEARAKAIVASREADGPFRTPDDLARIRGFGPRTIEGVKPYLAPLPGEGILVGGAVRSDPVE